MAKADTYSYEEIQRYLQHKMDAKEMYAFERAMMNDPFLADAIEGYRKSNDALAVTHRTEIERQLTANKQPAKVVPLRLHKTGWWRVAAIVFIIVTSAAISYMLLNTSVTDENTSSPIAQTESRETPVEKDSIVPPENTIQPEKTSGTEVRTYRKKTSPVHRRDAKDAAGIVMNKQSPQDTALVAMTGKTDERSLLANNETASLAKTRSMSAASKPMSAPAGVKDQELKGKAAGSNASVKSEAADRMIAKKDTNVSSEVTVGYGTIRKKDLTGSITTIENNEQAGEPQGGWMNFDNYVKREIQHFKDSANAAYNDAITLEFSIDEEGRPADIQIKEGADKALTDKAIQILKNGPKWKRNKDQSKVKVVIAF